MAALPTTVKSVLQKDRNSAALTMESTPMPVPNDQLNVLIKVHATSPCNGELWWARDYPGLIPEDKLPVVGQDVVGQVVKAPEGRFKPGDEVYGRLDATHPGGATEYTLAKESELALKPKSLNFLETAATPLSALTAWQGLFVHGNLEAAALKGDEAAKQRNGTKRVLITAATGGVGSWALQLASHAGAGAVVALAGPGNEETARKLGATEVLNYRQTDIATWAAEAPAEREVDFVLDFVGGNTLNAGWTAVKDGGVLLSATGRPVQPAGNTKTLAKSEWYLVDPSGTNLDEITALIDQGKLRPTIDSVWEFEQFQQAFDKLETGHAKGKIIIKVDGQV